jgi:DUF2075 family protein
MSNYDEFKRELEGVAEKLLQSKEAFDTLELKNHEEELRLQGKEKALKKLEEGVRQMAKERQIGFPWLAGAYDEYFELQDQEIIDFLRYKKTPALSASEMVASYSALRRKSEKEKRIFQKLVDYYETICPFLVDLREEVEDVSDEERAYVKEYTDEERLDAVTSFISKDEYRKLPSVERNQKALDRYWSRPKTKWQIGAMYERYVGYLYEMEGYEVNYHGLMKGLEDLGRDIIAMKGDEIVVIQCKNWSKFRTIHEKHIFQFFGTVFQYRDENPRKNVRAIFYTSTLLSPLARRFSDALKIELKEEEKMDKKYPCIKCNISQVDGTKIYHLPFDQQYDKTRIEPKKGEFYCATVKEAEDAGFRRAFRHHLGQREE